MSVNQKRTRGSPQNSEIFSVSSDSSSEMPRSKKRKTKNPSEIIPFDCTSRQNSDSSDTFHKIKSMTVDEIVDEIPRLNQEIAKTKQTISELEKALKLKKDVKSYTFSTKDENFDEFITSLQLYNVAMEDMQNLSQQKSELLEYLKKINIEYTNFKIDHKENGWKLSKYLPYGLFLAGLVQMF